MGTGKALEGVEQVHGAVVLGKPGQQENIKTRGRLNHSNKEQEF